MTLLRRWQEGRVALMFLTRLPVGRVPDPVPTLQDIRWAFPLVGLPVGLIVWGVVSGCLALGTAPMLSATLAFASLVLVTGALHLDGLADVADGFWGGFDPARRLEIMRDSRIGSYGVLALVVIPLIWITSLADLARQAQLAHLLLAATASRFAMLVLLQTLPSARPDGLGAQATAQSPAALLPGGLCLLPLMLLCGPQAIPVMLVLMVFAGLMAYLAKTRIGGQTGDVLGATQILSETAALATFSILI